MNNRLNQIIEYRTAGSRTDFAELMGWSRTYLSNLLSRESWGITPVCQILEVLPEVDARWLLLGEGDMLK